MSFKLHRVVWCAAIAVALSMSAGARPFAAPRADQDRDEHESRIRHVLLISIDGMHALDYENCVEAGTCPNLAALGTSGVTIRGRPPLSRRIRFPA
jgi:hypothetical protein